jgi:hypothetical protein
MPGFTILENVDARGFRCSVREFLPDGELLPFVSLSLTTPPIYEKNQSYLINDIDPKSLKAVRKTIKSDELGRLKISIDGGMHEIGINSAQDKPNLCIVSSGISNMNRATTGKDVSFSVKLLNKGMAKAENVKLKLTAIRNTTGITKSESEIVAINVNETKESPTPFTFRVNIDSIEIVRFKLTMQDKNRNEWTEFIEIPVKNDLPEIKDFVIADGKEFIVVKSGKFSDTLLLGSGNGDGVANPGESIVILVKDQDKLWRTFLHFNDKNINPSGINIRMSDNWTNLDHVGGSVKYSIPVISSDCPENHTIDFFAEYWLPDYPNHIIKQGSVKIQVTGRDNTPPVLQWIKIPGDNIIQVKLYDGTKIQHVNAKLISTGDPNKTIEAELKDEGINGDKAGADNVFSYRIPEQRFGNYTVDIEAADSFGNKMSENGSEVFILY